jgi:hypothetical protein
MTTAHAFADVIAPDDFVDLPDDDADRRFLYLARCRRVLVGPAVTVVFENRETMWFRIQELARVARIADPEAVTPELAWYAGLLPARGRLTAAVWVAEPGRRPSKALECVRRAVVNGRLFLRADDGREVEGLYRADRVTDKLIGLADWAEFRFTPNDVAAFADPAREWRAIVSADGYAYASEPLNQAVRGSLLTDLRGSDSRCPRPRTR